MSLANVAEASAWWQLTVGQVVSFTGAGNAWSIDAYDPDGTYFLMQLNDANVLAVNASAGTPSPNVLPAGVGTPHAYLIQGSASGLTVLADDGTTGTSASDFTKASAGMQLFGRGDGFNTNYRIGEFLYGTGTLTAPQIEALCTYIAGKWGTGGWA